MNDLARVAAAILRTERPLSAEFREQIALMVEALDQFHTEAQMTETAHARAKHPYYSKGLELIRAAYENPTE